MDRVKSTIESLSMCQSILRDLEEQISNAVLQNTGRIQEKYSGVDVNYQKDLSVYVDYLGTLQAKVSTFVRENNKALEERKRNLTEYNQNAYKKRNII